MGKVVQDVFKLRQREAGFGIAAVHVDDLYAPETLLVWLTYNAASIFDQWVDYPQVMGDPVMI